MVVTVAQHYELLSITEWHIYKQSGCVCLSKFELKCWQKVNLEKAEMLKTR